MADQNDFLEKLLGRFSVFLVNRYADPRLGFDNDPALGVFIPDLHWISTDRMGHFPDFHFNGMDLFPAFLGVLKNIPGVEVFQAAIGSISGDRTRRTEWTPTMCSKRSRTTRKSIPCTRASRISARRSCTATTTGRSRR